jgi:hypothetical protein
MVDALAAHLISIGVTGIGPIAITAHGDDHAASAKLMQHLRRHFKAPQSEYLHRQERQRS